MIKNKFLLALATLTFAGCVITDNGDDTGADTSNDAGESAGDTQAMTSAETGMTGMTGMTGAETSPGSESGADSGSAGGTDSGGGDMFCNLACTAPEDCCAMGLPEGTCPGEYPYDVDCVDGACTFGGCTTDEQCSFGGAVMGFECVDLEGSAVCVPVCTADADCQEGETCTGEADDGTLYCVLPPCTADADCFEGLTCDTASGACIPPTCTGDGDCMEGQVCR